MHHPCPHTLSKYIATHSYSEQTTGSVLPEELGVRYVSGSHGGVVIAVVSEPVRNQHHHGTNTQKPYEFVVGIEG